MAQLIPATNDARQTFVTVLGTQKVRLRLYYLEDLVGTAATGWFCDLILVTDTPDIIVTGERLSAAHKIAKNIISNFVGAIYVVPVTAPPQALIGTEPWGITHQLVYYNADELASA